MTDKLNYIVTLREDVNTGNGFVRLLRVTKYSPETVMQSFIDFRTTDGRTILVNKNNVKSILKAEGANENY